MSNERYIGNGLIAWRDVESQASREQLIDILDKKIMECSELRSKIFILQQDKTIIDFVQAIGATISRRQIGIPFQLETYTCSIHSRQLFFEANTVREVVKLALESMKGGE